MPKKYKVYCDGELIGEVDGTCWICENQNYGGPSYRGEKHEKCKECKHGHFCDPDEDFEPPDNSNFELDKSVLKKE